MAEEKIISITLEDLIRLDEEYAKKNGRQPNSIRNRIGDRERVILCCYQVKNKLSLLGIRSDILIFILTNIKLLFTDQSSSSLIDLKLNEITRVKANLPGFLGSGTVEIGITESHLERLETVYQSAYYLFQGTDDADFLKHFTGSLQKAMANFDTQIYTSELDTELSRPSQNVVLDHLAKLADLYKANILTEDEFKRAKERVLNNMDN
jgi:hypothetical protein